MIAPRNFSESIQVTTETITIVDDCIGWRTRLESGYITSGRVSSILLPASASICESPIELALLPPRPRPQPDRGRVAGGSPALVLGLIAGHAALTARSLGFGRLVLRWARRVPENRRSQRACRSRGSQGQRSRRFPPSTSAHARPSAARRTTRPRDERGRSHGCFSGSAEDATGVADRTPRVLVVVQKCESASVLWGFGPAPARGTRTDFAYRSRCSGVGRQITLLCFTPRFRVKEVL